jgi:copper chaperone
LTPPAAGANSFAMKTHDLTIQGMSCQHCVRAVREALGGVPGVGGADVAVGHAKVEANDDVTRAALAAAIAEAGFSVVEQ